MTAAIIVVSGVLWLWFLGCTISWRFGKLLLVEGMGIKSLEFAVLLLFSAGFVLFVVYEAIGQWILMAELALWLMVQFFCHEYFTIFGASERKIEGYNRCFEGSVKLFAQSKTRLIPDFYHVVLHLLLATDLTLLICKVLS